jgi:hypothetical protein
MTDRAIDDTDIDDTEIDGLLGLELVLIECPEIWDPVLPDIGVPERAVTPEFGHRAAEEELQEEPISSSTIDVKQLRLPIRRFEFKSASDIPPIDDLSAEDEVQ